MSVVASRLSSPRVVKLTKIKTIKVLVEYKTESFRILHVLAEERKLSFFLLTNNYVRNLTGHQLLPLASVLTPVLHRSSILICILIKSVVEESFHILHVLVEERNQKN